MQSAVARVLMGTTLALGLSGSALFAQEAAKKPLPTLLIKGEVVSLNASDAAAPLLTVKDRYGLETPIFLGQETAIKQGKAVVNPADLAPGTAVEVEYNFDINTAK